MASPQHSDNARGPRPAALRAVLRAPWDERKISWPVPAKETKAPEPPELDDFGLPIRKYTGAPDESLKIVPPKVDWVKLEEAKSSADTDKGPTKEDKAGAAEQVAQPAEPSPEQAEPSAEQAVPQPSEKPDEEKAGSDSDAEEFKDAESYPVNGTTAESSKEEDSAPPPPAPRSSQDPTPTVEKAEQHETPADSSEKSHDDMPQSNDQQNDSTDASGTPPAEAHSESAGANTENKAQAQDSKGETPKEETPTGEKPAMGHVRETSITGGHAMSEFSHQQLTTKKEEEGPDEDTGWQTMPAFAPYKIYDDDNKLVAEEHVEAEDEKDAYAALGGAGKGYTRVIQDDDVESATSMDENTQYLFKEVGGGTSLEEDEEAQRDAVSQLQATKDLLTEGQRIAYVGLTRLELSAMLKGAEDMPSGKKTKKEVQLSAESMRMWSQKIMIRVYTHMEISPAEQVMIEQLSAHGVMPKDLTGLLMANARVKNPMADERVSSSGSEGKSPRLSSSDEVGGSKDEEAHDDDEAVADPPPAYETHDAEDLPAVRTPSQLPTTEKIDIDLRWTVLCDLFLVLIADSVYDSRSRLLLERVGDDLSITTLDICRFEKKVTDALEMQQNAEKENWNEAEHMEHRRKLALRRRYMLMGLATVGGGLVIGLSAGLMAPLIGAGLAAGFTTIGVTGTTGFLAGAGGAAIITSSAAASGGIIGIKAANRRTGAVKTFEYRPLHNNKRVNLIVTVSGWMTGKVDDVRLPYSTVDPVMGDIYSVLWEPEMLTSMGDTINILATEALTQGLQQLLGSTILVGLMAALQLPVVLTKLAYLIDNPWAVSLDRATAAGLILADSLIDRNLGTRPVTLVGYSLGSRVIFSCLLELARRGAHGLVQNVYIFGSPVVVKQEEFIRARLVVAGRFVNGYNRNDWILGYLFRLTNGGIRRVAGLAAVEGVPHLENMDLSEEVQGHMNYRTAMPKLLRKCGWLVESDEFSEIEDPDPENHQARQRELINEIEEARKELENEGQKGRRSTFGALFGRGKKKAKKRQEWEVYEGEQPPPAGGASPPAASSSKTEDQDGNNHGVLFDVDAIRAELAREQQLAADESVMEQLQIRELQSTLPPMKLELTPVASPNLLPPPAATARRNSRDSSREDTPQPERLSTSRRASRDYRPSDERSRTPTASTLALPHSRNASTSGLPYLSPTSSRADVNGGSSSVAHGEDEDLDGAAAAGRGDDEIQLTFDTSFDDSHHEARPPVPPKDASLSYSVSRGSEGLQQQQQRPEMVRNAQTTPNVTLADPWAAADEDDEAEFGKEKEIELTFA